MEINELIEILRSEDDGAWIETENGELVIDGHFSIEGLTKSLEDYVYDPHWRMKL